MNEIEGAEKLVSGGVGELGVKELGVSGDCPYRAETLNSKLQTLNSQLTEGQNLLFAVAHCTVERRSRVILQGTSACPP